jgi:hypothetical protein
VCFSMRCDALTDATSDAERILRRPREVQAAWADISSISSAPKRAALSPNQTPRRAS